MKILILSQFAGSPKHGMVLRNYNWAYEMTRMGHDVTIIASSYAHPRFEQPNVSRNVEVEYIDGIRYIWLKAKLRYNPKNFISRIVSMMSFMIKCYLTARKHKRKYDIVIASSPQPLVIYAAKKLANINGAKLVFDIRDLWPLSLMGIGNASKFNPFIRLIQHAEDYACKHADLITAVPINCENYLKGRGLAEGKFLFISNGINESEIEPKPLIALPDQHQKVINDIKNDGGFIIGYTGSIGSANALDVAIKSLHKTANKKIHFMIIGKGAFVGKLKALNSKLGLQNQVHILPPIGKAQISNFLSQIDVGYCGTRDKELFKYGMSPTKISDYMLASKPIIYAMGDPNNFVERSECGISCRAENIDDISNAMHAMFVMAPENRIEIGQKGRDWLLENNMVSVHMQRMFKKLF